MAKKRNTSRGRKAARPKTARRTTARRRQPARPRKGGDADPLHVAAALLAMILVGLAIYLYQTNHQEVASTSNPPVAMEKK